LKNFIDALPFYKKISDSRLYLRIMRAFGFLVIGPILLLALFSGVFLNLGMQSWFNQKVQIAIEESGAVAQAYLEEHQEVIKQSVRFMVRDIQENLPQIPNSKQVLDEFLTFQSALRSLGEAIIFTGQGQVIGRSQFSFSLEFEEISGQNLERARQSVVIYPNRRNDRVIALTQINREKDLFLIVSRKVDQKVLMRLLAVKEAAAAYKNLFEERRLFSVFFTVIFLIITAVIFVLALWRGAVFSKQFLKPIQNLIEAARQIQKGFFQTRVPIDPQANIDELETLALAFNQMVDEIALQQKELKTTHIELQRRHEFTENVLSGVSSGVLGLDLEGHIRVANQRTFEILKCDASDFIGKTLTEVLPDWSFLLNAKEYPLETELAVGPLGFQQIFRVHVTRPKGHESLQEWVITFEDITKFLSIQRQAAWSDVARRVAHEIKNPLTPIQLSAERLKRRYLPQIKEDPETFKKCIETITRQVEGLGKIISEFSRFARLPKPSFSRTLLKEVSESVLLLHTQAYPLIQWHITIPEEIEIQGDIGQITQVLTNLLKNAIEAVEEKNPHHKGGNIWFSLIQTTEEIICEIQDDGVGFPIESPNHLTEPYNTTKSKGTGLGLAIVKKIVEDHEGILVLEKRPEGGAMVRVILHPPGVKELSPPPCAPLPGLSSLSAPPSL
jgi:two-component system nitrogen regulation sensor histidine kinase NtrY